MSVLLTACKQQKQKAIEKALKQKAEQKRLKREARSNAMTEQIGIVPPESSTCKVWTFTLQDRPYSVIFDTNRMEVRLNGSPAETKNDFRDNGAVITFNLGGHCSQIVGKGHSKGISYALLIDGNLVPE